eukprot:139670-Rhodomonas_salina.1
MESAPVRGQSRGDRSLRLCRSALPAARMLRVSLLLRAAPARGCSVYHLACACHVQSWPCHVRACTVYRAASLCASG